MSTESTQRAANLGDRLVSLDFFRGLTMFLLVAEFSGIFHDLTAGSAPAWLHAIGEQFHHVKWDGLKFWDLIQPYFMFIVGVAMPLSFAKRRNRGASESDIRRHVFVRAFLLLFLGWWLYCIDAGQIVFKFQNVLAQLSVTYLIAYFLMDRSSTTQIVWSVLLIALTTAVYMFFSVEGFDQPFTGGKNFGTWLDLQYSGADMGGNWVSFNAIPTAAHTIWGVLAGQLLTSKVDAKEKLSKLLIAAGLLLVSGYLICFLGIPIIKRICTASFILVSGGWTVLSLAICYWLLDIEQYRKGLWIFTIVGLNPLFIYLFAHIGGGALLKGVVTPAVSSLLSWTGNWGVSLIASTLTLYLLWYLCYWLFKRNIFIRI